MSSQETDIEARGSNELLEKLKNQLKTNDDELLREHILKLAKAWGLQVRLPAKGQVA